MAAKRPSQRRHKLETDVELKLIPVMSLLCVLIPILLQAAVFVKQAAQEVNLPSSDDVRYLGEAAKEALAETLTLAVTDEGFVLASGSQTLARLPKTRGAPYDFGALGQAVRRAKDRFPSQDAIILLVEDGVFYEDVIHAMDQCRPHFPALSLADRVEAGGGG